MYSYTYFYMELFYIDLLIVRREDLFVGPAFCVLLGLFRLLLRATFGTLSGSLNPNISMICWA